MSESPSTAAQPGHTQILPTWLKPSVRYEGAGVAEFESPHLVAYGPAWAEFDEAGRGRGEMLVYRVASADTLPLGEFHILQEGPPIEDETDGSTSIHVGRGSKFNRCLSVTIQAEEGLFVGRPPIGLGFNFGFDEKGFRTSYRFQFFDGMLVVGGRELAFWSIPLVNFVSSYRDSYVNLNEHPLSLQKISSNESEGAKVGNTSEIATSKAISFQYRGLSAHIQPLPDSTEREERLTGGGRKHHVTAIMAGKLPKVIVSSDDFIELFPSDLASLLSIATGTDVGWTCIQAHSPDGSLVARIHKPLSCSPYSTGHKFLNELFDDSIGKLLTAASSSTHFDSALLRVTSAHIVRGGIRDQTIEDRLSHLFRGLDGLCRMLRISGRATVDTFLSDSEARDAKQWITELSKTLRARASECSQSGHHEKALAYQRFAQNVESSRTIYSGFGEDVGKLLKSQQLHDLIVMNSYYKVHPGPGNRDWLSTLSFYRGSVMHDGYIKLDKNPRAYYEAASIANHLQDLTVRILLKLLSYPGEYLPSTIGMLAPSSLDWVTPMTEPDLLGYSPA